MTVILEINNTITCLSLDTTPDCLTGGSLIKIVILQPKDDETDRVTELTYHRDEVGKAIDCVQSRYGQYLENKVLYTTGVGGHQYKDRICTQLKVRYVLL